jgi:DHA1 family tetracycline resistance protein-like MFS transporter
MNHKKSAERTLDAAEEKFFTTPLIIIFVTVFIDLIGFGMVIPILPYYANNAPFNATPRDIGFLVASYSLMQFFFSPVLGRLSDRYGRRPILFFSLLGSAVGYFVIGFANSIFLVFLGRIIGGITGGNISTAQAYIADVTSKKNRAKGMGLFGAAFGLGFIFGPAIAGILSKYGVHVPFFCAAALSLVNAIALYFVLPESLKASSRATIPARANRGSELYGSLRNKESRKISNVYFLLVTAFSVIKNRLLELFESLKNKEFREINIVYFLLVTAFSIMTYAFVLYTAYRFGYTPEQNGYLFAFVGTVSIIAQGFLFGRLERKFGETPLIVAGCILMVVSLFAIPVVGPQSGGLVGLLIGTAILSFGNSLASPGLTSLASKTAQDHEQGRTMGIMQSGASLARAVGPMLGGVLLNNAINEMDDFTLYRTFWTASAIMFVAFLVAVYFARSARKEITAS